MSLPDQTAALPTEILDHIFSDLSNFSNELRNVLACSCVCRRWRPIALQQDAFACSIRWQPRSDAAGPLSDPDLLARRLSASNKPLYFFIDASNRYLRDFLVNHLLPALADNLYRVRKLNLWGKASNMRRLLNALNGPAPILSSLALAFSGKFAYHLAPSAAFLGGHAPMLKYCILSTVASV